MLELLYEDSPLKGKRILLGICGGIAAYKSIELLRSFQKCGADVSVILTKMALKFIGEETVKSFAKCYYEIEGMEHINLAHNSDVIVIAPATANIIGKVANGIGDTLLTTTLLARTSPVVVVPSMNWAMYKNPIVEENMEKLKKYGFLFVEPEKGELACGEYGEGKFPDISKILFFVEKAVYRKNENGKVVITAGPTREFIDNVRYISNMSSGLTGYFLAREFSLCGFDVSLITGGEKFDADFFCKVKNVVSASDMERAVEKEFEDDVDIFVSAAAVSDFSPKEFIKGKIEREKEDVIKIEFKKTNDILKTFAKRAKISVGFSLEVDNVVERAREKMSRKGVDIMVFNTPSSFSSPYGEYGIISSNGVEFLGKISKRKISQIIVKKSIELKKQREKEKIAEVEKIK